ncbi:hypothetical protein GCM10011506_10060 [Marivirga lumbricoides]|uniref:GAF domain-containing protein n=1 Tax=Marivirga lumbricoides TaxID=1046115 RepID=A0ABQ1LQ06_9BACT|nr:hypothetical protein GCM10011506_10060 [Marivirga lumbricoides]
MLIIKNRRIIDDTIQVKEAANAIKFQLDAHLDIVRELDVSLRGFAITKEERYLYIKPDQLKAKMQATFAKMDSLLNAQGFDNEEAIQALRDYQSVIRMLVNDHATMAGYIRNGNEEGFLEIFMLDKGSKLGPPIEATNKLINGYQDQLTQQAEERYQAAMQNNIIIQVAMVLLGIPAIGLVLYKVNKDGERRQNLLKELAENNSKYLFNSGKKIEKITAENVIEGSINQLQKASDFINKISEGNLEVTWEGLNEENRQLNEISLAGRLSVMRDKMIHVKEMDSERNWTNEGLSMLGELLRKNNDLSEICDEIISKLIVYLKANQGALFLIEKQESDEEECLILKSAYAYNRKKFIDRKISLGQGLAGQTWLEKETIYLKEIPQDYIKITSGLGEALPENILIVPLKLDEKVIGVLEIASFSELLPYQITFVERLAESMASTFITLKMNEQTKELLSQAQQQAEEMLAQEEEMRQNMEELEATQEEMRRKERQFLEEIENLKKQIS